MTVNLAESPLGWLFSRGLLTAASSMPANGCAATGNERSCPPGDDGLGQRADVRQPRRLGARADLAGAQIDAKRRFEAAVASAGPGLADILWRVVCAGEGMRDAESALGWPARAGKLVLTFALDRVADYYRVR